ncbi:putative porin [Paraburkholderia bryophila]|uniref:Putative porin n=1 Tax=Paraburkholderia bryophila TaxID=420952 RepID=A0A7Y9W796_9BURK|nr:putative porin [Paraburkholderia bryophila]
MKHIIAAGLTAICATTGAWAQSSVTLYGSLDAGIAYISNAGGSSKWIEEQGNMQPDRWGLKGVEDLGGGLKTVFQLENGFYTNTGAFAKAGVLFNRQAFVGLSSDKIGTVTLGHQTPFSFDVLGPLSTAYLAASWYAFHPGNIDELADTGVVPFDNSVKFRSASFNGFSVGAMMGLGNTTNFSTGKTLSFALSYANGPFKGRRDVCERARPHAVDHHDGHHQLPGGGRGDLHGGQGREHGRGRVLPVRQVAGAWSVHPREAGIRRSFEHVPKLRCGCELSVHTVQ